MTTIPEVYPSSVVLAVWLIENDVCTDPEAQLPWPVFASMLRDGQNLPSNMVGIFDTTGIVHSRFMVDGEYSKRDGIQVQVRSTNYLLAWRMVKFVERRLLSIKNTVIEVKGIPHKIFTVAQTSTPVPLGLDATGSRHLITFNLTTIIKEI